MGKFQEDYYRYLCEREGFYMDQFKSQYDNEDKWIAIKRLQQGLYVVFITKEGTEDIDTEEAYNYIKGKGLNFKFHSIVISSGNYIIGNNKEVSRLVINATNLQVIYCDENCEVLKNIFYLIINKNNNVQNNKIDKKTFISQNAITFSLILINVIIFVIEAIKARNIMDIDVYTLVDLGAQWGPLISKGEYWRLITCAFLHGGIMHIFFNMYALYILGQQIEQIYGKAKYFLIYMGSAIGGSLLGVIFEPNVVAVGASGAIFGLLGALLVFAIKERKRLKSGAMKNLVIVIGLNLFISITVPNIDLLGHLGGFLVGVVLASLFIIGSKK